MIKDILKIQAKIKGTKSQYNEFANFAYRKAEDILAEVKPLLLESGLLITLNDSIEQIGDRFYVKSTVIVTDGNKTLTSSALAREPLTLPKMSAPQVTGSASSYARKYALCGFFAIDDSTADPDSKPNKSLKDAIGAMDKTISFKDRDSTWNQYNDFSKENEFIASYHAATKRITIQVAVKEMSEVKSRKEMVKVWNKYPKIQEEKSFLTALEVAGSSYPKPMKQ